MKNDLIENALNQIAGPAEITHLRYNKDSCNGITTNMVISIHKD